MGDCINCKSLDNRVSVYILIEMLCEMKGTPPYDVYAVFTVQEEISVRGLMFPENQPRLRFWFRHHNCFLTLQEAPKRNRYQRWEGSVKLRLWILQRYVIIVWSNI